MHFEVSSRRPQIRIVRWSDVPDRACCTACARIFSLTPTEAMSVEEARDALERLFLRHACVTGFRAQW